MRDKTVEDAMTPLESVYMLNINAIIDRDTMKDVSIMYFVSLLFSLVCVPCPMVLYTI